ncbi:MAG: pitrilysin family protein [Pseudomonadota bacterium]
MKLGHRIWNLSYFFIGAAILIAMDVRPINAGEVERSVTEQMDIPYEMFTLENGLTTIVHTDKSRPTIFASITFKVGSKDEPPGQSGFAHLFEHLLFQGSENANDDYFKFAEKGGAGMVNGSTSRDRTNYFAAFPKESLDYVLWLESDRMINLLGAVDQAKLDEQRGVVKNEKRQYESQPYASMRRKYGEGLFPKDHPYNHSIIGSMEDLDKATLDDVHAWFEKYYGASNAVLLLAGDIELEEAREKVTKYFGAAQPGAPLEKMSHWAPIPADSKREIIYDNVAQRVLLRSWVLPPYGERDTAVWGMLSGVLFGNEKSPLKKRLIEELKVATAVSGSVYSGEIASQLIVRVSLTEDADLEYVERLLEEELQKFGNDGPDRAILAAEKAKRDVQFLLSAEKLSTRGTILVSGLIGAGDPHFYKSEAKWRDEASPSELARLARDVFSTPHYQATYLPFGHNETGTPDVDRSKLPDVSLISQDVPFPEISTATLSNGIDVVYLQQDDLPLMRVGVDFAVGQIDDSPVKSAAVKGMFELLTKGTTQYDADALSAEWDLLGTTPRLRSSSENSLLFAFVRTPDFAKAMHLISDMVRNSTFPQKELDKWIAKARISASQGEVTPSVRAPVFLSRAIFGAEHVRGNQVSDKILDAIERADLVRLRSDRLRPDNMTIFVLGSLEFALVEQTLEKVFSSWNLPAPAVPKPTINMDVASIEKKVILIDEPGSSQSTVYAAQLLPRYEFSQETALKIWNQAFGGSFTSRLNLNIREDKGWAYGARSRVRKYQDGDRLFSFGAKVQTDKTSDAMEEMHREIKEMLTSRPLSASEFSAIVEARAGSEVSKYLGADRYLESVYAMFGSGFPLNYGASEVSRVKSVKLADANGIARELIDPDKLTWVVVGDLSEIEADVRALGLGEVEVWDASGHRLR